MLVIRVQLLSAHAVQLQLFLHLVQSRCRGMFRHVSRVQVINPLLQRRFCHPVEVIHLQDIILRIKLAHLVHLERLLLEGAQLQHIPLVNPHELRLPVIHEILAVSQREIHDVHAVHLAYLVVSLSAVDILRHQLRSPEQHPLEIRILIVVLHLDEHQFPFRVLRQHVHAVVLVELILLITFTLQQFLDRYLFLQQCSEQSLQHRIVGLVAQQALHRPVKPNITFHTVCILVVDIYKVSK